MRAGDEQADERGLRLRGKDGGRDEGYGEQPAEDRKIIHAAGWILRTAQCACGHEA